MCRIGFFFNIFTMSLLIGDEYLNVAHIELQRIFALSHRSEADLHASRRPSEASEQWWKHGYMTFFPYIVLKSGTFSIVNHCVLRGQCDGLRNFLTIFSLV